MAKKRNLILKSKDPFTKVPNRLRDLGPLLSKGERRIYPYAISAYVIFAGSGEAFNPGIRYICERLGCSKDTAQKALDWMVCKNMLRLHFSGNGLRDEYEFTSVSEWKPENRWTPPVKGRLKKDSSSKLKDAVSDETGRTLSCAAGHNNERSPMKETMNDDERKSSSSTSSSNPSKPKEEAKPIIHWSKASEGPKRTDAEKIVDIFKEVRPILRGKRFFQEYAPTLQKKLFEKSIFVSRKCLLRQASLEMEERFKKFEHDERFRHGGRNHQNLWRQVAYAIDQHCDAMEGNAPLFFQFFDPSFHLDRVCDHADILNQVTSVTNRIAKIIDECFDVSFSIQNREVSADDLRMHLAFVFSAENSWLAKRLLLSELILLDDSLEREFNAKIRCDYPELFDSKHLEYFEYEFLTQSFCFGVGNRYSGLKEAYPDVGHVEGMRLFFNFLHKGPCVTGSLEKLAQKNIVEMRALKDELDLHSASAESVTLRSPTCSQSS